MGLIEIRTTVTDAESASRLARELVARGLAACVQVEAGVASTYHWKGLIETTVEHRLTIKSTAARLDAAIVAIRELHPYDLPEILWTAVDASPEYEAWAVACLGAPHADARPLVFEASVHPRPPAAAPGETLKDAFGDWPTLSVTADAAAIPFTISGDACLDRLASLARTAVEPDGTFVWSCDSDVAGETTGRWHVWGAIHERNDAVLFVELRGSCRAEDLDLLLSTLGWPQTAVMFQLPRAGVFVDDRTFRHRAAVEAQSSA